MIASNLSEARATGAKKYYNECKRHGLQAFAVLDNSCPRCVTDAHAKRRKNNYVYNRSRERFNEIKMRSRERGIEFTLTLEWLREALDNTNACPYLGIVLNETQEDCIAFPDRNKSIDRLDPTKGYVPENVIVCSNRANRIKNDATVDELHLIAENLQRLTHGVQNGVSV